MVDQTGRLSPTNAPFLSVSTPWLIDDIRDSRIRLIACGSGLPRGARRSTCLPEKSLALRRAIRHDVLIMFVLFHREKLPAAITVSSHPSCISPAKCTGAYKM